MLIGWNVLLLCSGIFQLFCTSSNYISLSQVIHAKDSWGSLTCQACPKTGDGSPLKGRKLEGCNPRPSYHESHNLIMNMASQCGQKSVYEMCQTLSFYPCPNPKNSVWTLHVRALTLYTYRIQVLAENRMGTEGAIALCQFLKHNRNLHKVDLTCK